MSSENVAAVHLEENVTVEMPLHQKPDTNRSRQSSKSSAKSHDEKHQEHDESHSKITEKKEIETKKSPPEKSSPTKKKFSFSVLFSCGGSKKSKKLNGEKISAIFKSNIEDSNKFSKGILCHSGSGSVFSSFPGDFKPTVVEMKRLLKVDQKKGTKFSFANVEFDFEETYTENGYLGVNATEHLVVGVRFMNALMMIAIWADDADNNKDIFEDCFQTIINSSK